MTVAGEILTINVDDFAELFSEMPADPTEEECIEQLTTKLSDYPGEIAYLAIGNFTWDARFCRDIMLAVFAAMAGRAKRPTIIRMGITDRSFESFKDLQQLVNIHRYVVYWILTFNVDDIPRMSDQILKPFHGTRWVNKLTILSDNQKRDLDQDARDNFAVSVIDLTNSGSHITFEHIFSSNAITY